jgi:hypothetical protein
MQRALEQVHVSEAGSGLYMVDLVTRRRIVDACAGRSLASRDPRVAEALSAARAALRGPRLS